VCGASHNHHRCFIDFLGSHTSFFTILSLKLRRILYTFSYDKQCSRILFFVLSLLKICGCFACLLYVFIFFYQNNTENNMSETAEHQYIDYVKHILDCGELKTNRTGIATKSIFGGTMR